MPYVAFARLFFVLFALTTLVVGQDTADTAAVPSSGELVAHGPDGYVLGPRDTLNIRVVDMEEFGDKAFPVENGIADGPAVAFVRPHDVMLRHVDNTEPNADATLPGAAVIRLVTVLGPKAWVELSLGPQVIAAEIGRDVATELALAAGKSCKVQLRLPRFFGKADGGAALAEARGAKR